MTTSDDVIDQIVPLSPGQATYAVRHERAKVVASTQGSYEAMFSVTVEGISVTERLLVALHACRLSNASSLATHYRDKLLTTGVERNLIEAVGSNASQPNLDTRRQTILHFTSTLILRPLDGDKPAIDALVAAGLSTPAIVALGQLIAFLSYQIRMTAGLQAMAALEQTA
jgi:uncharacterized protein YciW